MCESSGSDLPRVLYLDDDPAFGRVIRLLLDGIADVRLVKEPRAALDVAREGWPDLLISDMNMPGLTGLEVYERFRKIPGSERIIFGIVTSYPIPDDAPAASGGPIGDLYAAGIKHIINKDAGLQGLRDAVRKMVASIIGSDLALSRADPDPKAEH